MERRSSRSPVRSPSRTSMRSPVRRLSPSRRPTVRRTMRSPNRDLSYNEIIDLYEDLHPDARDIINQHLGRVPERYNTALSR